MTPSSFAELGLPPTLLQAIAQVGYEAPSPIQAMAIPPLLQGKDLLGQAQTGTGKTAAFALPILARLEPSAGAPQALVLTPTRELAIQVAEAFQRYAHAIPGFHVLPIYGGQGYGTQLSALRRGLHVIVGTPGRIIDHLDRGSLDLSALRTLVLDEADEMLRMGFVEEVERILSATPQGRQTALFSATLPAEIRRIARTHMREPAEITIAAKTATATNIRQRQWLVSGMHKLDALTRILEAETFEAMIVFTRTKLGTEELAEKLQARGFPAAAINGDMVQQQRERTIAQLREGEIDILVATDVAARGLDVERISHVINYDLPSDAETYTHRIGRTGRAGRSGEAILFVTPRERGLLKAIERSTRQPIEALELPTIRAVNAVRIARFKDRITETLDAGGLEAFASIVSEYEQEHGVAAIDIAAALARMSRGGLPLLLVKGQDAAERVTGASDRPSNRLDDRSSAQGSDRPAERTVRRNLAAHDSSPSVRWGAEPGGGTREDSAKPVGSRPGSTGFQTFRVQVGEAHGAKPGNLMGAIANEAGLEARQIGRIRVFEQHSLVELPEALPARIIKHLSKVRVAGQMLRIHPTEAMPPRGPRTSASESEARAERPARPATSRPAASPRPHKNKRPR
ncbi:MAG: DEAD/DEAH box helicase [Betaproteobacteria bacterium]|nr:DEAD/DEAH box helicase [Betaproteobacteria bacterium]